MGAFGGADAVTNRKLGLIRAISAKLGGVRGLTLCRGVVYAYTVGGRTAPLGEETDMITTIEQAKQDKFMQFAAADLIRKGIDESTAWDLVMNTYADEL